MGLVVLFVGGGLRAIPCHSGPNGAHTKKGAHKKKQIIKHFHQIAALVNIDIWLQSLTQTNKQLQEISLII